MLSVCKSDLINKLDILPIYIDVEKSEIVKKISKNSILLSNISETTRGLPFQKKIDDDGIPILRGKNIGKFNIYRKIDSVKVSRDILNSKKIKFLQQKKILSQNIVAHVINPIERIIIIATIDNSEYLTLDTVMNTVITNKSFSEEYILALMNSKLGSWFYYWFVYNRSIRTMHFDKYYLGKIPIKNISSDQQKPFMDIVDKILKEKKNNPLSDTTNLENDIDNMIYELYGLTKEEIKIVEGK